MRPHGLNQAAKIVILLASLDRPTRAETAIPAAPHLGVIDDAELLTIGD